MGLKSSMMGGFNVTWDHGGIKGTGWVQRLGAGIVDWSHKW